MAERNIGRREFIKGLVAGAAAGYGLTDLRAAAGERAVAYKKARHEVVAGGTPAPNPDDLRLAHKIDQQNGATIMKNYTGEELQRAQAAKDQQLTFDNEVKLNVDAQVQRGEAPSDTRMNIDMGLTLPAIGKTIKHFIWDTQAPRPLGTPVEAATRELFKKNP